MRKSKERGGYSHRHFDENYYMSKWNNYNFHFPHSTLEIENLMNFVNQVPQNNYVLFYFFRWNYCSQFLVGQPVSERHGDMYNKTSASVDSFKNYPNHYPHILLFKKGNSKFFKEAFYSEEMKTDNQILI